MFDYLTLGLAALIATVLVPLALTSVVATFFPDHRFSRWVSDLLERKPKNLSDFNDQEWFSLSDISIVEKYIPQIESVVVISSVVQEPQTSLYEAVKDNFQQGARYAFYVSSAGTTAHDLAVYRGWFEAIFNLAKHSAPNEGENSRIQSATFELHFSVRQLGFDWHSAPFIFYTYQDGESGTSIIAFRGDDEGVGISQLYRRVDPDIAADLLNLASAASHEFSEELPTESAGIEIDLPSTPIEASNVVPMFDKIARRAHNR